MYESSAGETLLCLSGSSNAMNQKNNHRNPRTPIVMNAQRQLNVVANQTVAKETITPTFVPELNKPVANARSFCGNHIATALIDAGKFAASAIPRKNRTTANPTTVATNPCAAAINDHKISAPAKLAFTPKRSIAVPTREGNAAYAAVNANVTQP